MAKSVEDLFKTISNSDIEQFEHKRKICQTITNFLVKEKRNADVDDNKFFRYGLITNIADSLNSFYSNLIVGNIDWVGSDNCFRSIDESLILLEIDKEGLIDQDHKRLYRLQTEIIELGNFSNGMNIISEEDIYKHLTKTSKEFLNEAAFIFKTEVSNKDLIKKCTDSYFFLQKKLKSKPHLDIEGIVKLYKPNSPSINELLSDYRFYSKGVHPYFVESEDYKNLLNQTRLKKYNKTKEKAEETIKSLVEAHYIDDIDDVNISIEQNDLFKDILKKIKNICNFVMGKVKNKYSEYTTSYFNDIAALVQDMFLCACLGQYRMVITKFKPFIESSSLLFYLIYEINGKTAQKEATECAIQWVAISHYNEEILGKKPSKEINSLVRSRLMESFELYYNTCYESFDSFFNEATSKNCNLLASGMTFKRLVDTFIGMFPADVKSSISWVYYISLDCEHGNGFLYTQPELIASWSSFECLSLVLTVLIFFVLIFENELTNEKDKENFIKIEEYLKKLREEFSAYNMEHIFDHFIK